MGREDDMRELREEVAREWQEVTGSEPTPAELDDMTEPGS